MQPDFTSITEMPGSGLTPEQWTRMHHRYALACNLAQDRRVLEVACGAGVALPSLARRAAAVVGGDYTGAVLAAAQRGVQPPHHNSTLTGTDIRPDAPTALAQFDAQCLPFAANSFDLLLLFEAIYYLDAPAHFLREARRVLAPGGHLLIGTENPAWPDFIPGKFSTRYWHVPELYGMLRAQGFPTIAGYGAFPVTTYSARQQQLARLRRFLVRWGLVPKHPRVRRLLQRVGYGTLYPLPRRLDEMQLNEMQLDRAAITPLAPHSLHPEYKVVYLHATLD
ncbi:MAG: class I SAM-dependent methyltransferase [Litorilinea sp.]